MPRSFSWRPTAWAAVCCCALAMAAGCTEKPGGPVGPGPDPNPAPVSYAADIEPLFTRYGCIGCHGNPGNNGYSVRSYELVLIPGIQAAGRGLLPVKAGDPDSSYMVWKLSGRGPAGEVITGSRMPQGRAPIAPSDLDLIRAWIAAGAPDT